MKRELTWSLCAMVTAISALALGGCKDRERDGDPRAGSRSTGVADNNPDPQRTVKPSDTPKDPMVGTDSRGLPSGPSGGTTGAGAGSGTSGTETGGATPPKK